jgi:hypothetical protein
MAVFTAKSTLILSNMISQDMRPLYLSALSWMVVPMEAWLALMFASSLLLTSTGLMLLGLGSLPLLIFLWSLLLVLYKPIGGLPSSSCINMLAMEKGIPSTLQPKSEPLALQSMILHEVRAVNNV